MVHVNLYFDVVYGINLELTHLALDPKGIRFVARTSENNGVVARVKVIPNIKPNPPDTISVAGGGSVMESFLQKEPYYSGRDLFYLKPKSDVNFSDKQLLYYCMCLKANKYKFSFGRQANKTLATLDIPSIDKIPAWVESVYIPTKPKLDSAANKTINLNIDLWKWFSYADLFIPQRGDVNVISDIKDKWDGLPVISATTRNNGVIGYSQKVEGKQFPSNCITIANTGQGSVGFPAFQAGAFYATNNITVLIPKFICNKYIGLFLCALIKEDRYKYSWGRIVNEPRVNDAKIRLPVDNSGKPDWQFMEDYIKSLPYSSNL